MMCRDPWHRATQQPDRSRPGLSNRVAPCWLLHFSLRLQPTTPIPSAELLHILSQTQNIHRAASLRRLGNFHSRMGTGH